MEAVPGREFGRHAHIGGDTPSPLFITTRGDNCLF